jgi:hypothetical protein
LEPSMEGELPIKLAPRTSPVEGRTADEGGAELEQQEAL